MGFLCIVNYILYVKDKVSNMLYHIKPQTFSLIYFKGYSYKKDLQSDFSN